MVGFGVSNLVRGKSRVARIAPPLSEREFAKLFSGQLLSSIGDGIAVAGLAFAVFAIGGSAKEVGWVLAAGNLTIIPLVLGGGILGDRLARRMVMIGSDTLRCASQAAAAALVLSRHATVGELAVLQGLWGVGAAFFRPAASSIVPQVVSRQNLQAANGLMSSAPNVAMVVGPVLAGGIVVAAGPGWIFAANAVSFLASIASLWVLRPQPAEAGTGRRAGILADLRGGWRQFTQRTWLWASVLLAACFQLVVLSCIAVLGPAIAQHSLGGAGVWGLLLGSFGIGALAGSLTVGHLRFRRPLLTGTAALLPYCALLTALVTAGPAAIALIFLMCGYGLSVFTVLQMTLIQATVPGRALSRVMAYGWLASTAALPVGYVIVGPVADLVGLKSTCIGAAVIWGVAVALVLLTPGIRAVRAPAMLAEATGNAAN